MKIDFKYIFYGLFALAFSFIMAFVFSNPPVAVENPKIEKSELFTLINEWRKENGYSEYQEHPFACLLAEERLPQVTKNWSHSGFLDSVSEIRGVNTSDKKLWMLFLEQLEISVSFLCLGSIKMLSGVFKVVCLTGYIQYLIPSFFCS
jgi:hypothetical protein